MAVVSGRVGAAQSASPGCVKPNTWVRVGRPSGLRFDQPAALIPGLRVGQLAASLARFIHYSASSYASISPDNNASLVAISQR